MFSNSGKRIVIPLQIVSLIAMVIHLVYIFDDFSPFKVYSKEVPVLMNALIIFLLSLRIPNGVIPDKKITFFSVILFVFYGIGDFILVYPVAIGSAKKFVFGALFFLAGHYMYFYNNYKISNLYFGGRPVILEKFPERKNQAKKYSLLSEFFVVVMILVPNSVGISISLFGAIYLTVFGLTIYFGYGIHDNIRRCLMSIFGAVCFQVSDTVLSTNDFLHPCPWFKYVYMVTYWMATSFYFLFLATFYDDLAEKKIELFNTKKEESKKEK